MDNTVGRLQSYLPSHQFDVIIGSLLGDARLECRSSGKRYPVTARLRIHHGERQKEYVFWKYNVLENLVLRKPRRIKCWVNPATKEDYYSWYFHTRSIEEQGVKILPENIFQFITPRALAIWFMDDGSDW